MALTAEALVVHNNRHFEQLSKIAEAKHGKLVSESYQGSNVKLTFQCSAGHQWKSTPSSIKKEHWCVDCLYNKDHHYEELQSIAKSYGGRVVSKKYTNSSSKMTFECIDNHQWQARPSNIKKGRWCPSCSSNRSENLVRSFFEFAFGKKFNGASPKWLTSNRFPKMILDGYSSELSIAFEYHGRQHYNYIPHFHDRQGNRSFEKQQERDRLVRELCIAHHVHLVEIPYLDDGYSQSDFLSHMRAIFKKEFGKEFSDDQINTFCQKPFMTSKLQEMQETAKKLGGNCLSSKYLGARTKHLWGCKEGHEWESVYQSIKRGHWCPYCSGNKLGNPLDDLNKIAEIQGGRLLSTSYTNIKSKYSFVCERGHHFKTAGDAVLNQNKWCRQCYDNRGFYKFIAKCELNKITVRKEDYKDSNSILTLTCKNNHSWQSSMQNYTRKNSIFICKECLA